MANTLRFKRGLVSGIPNGALGEPLFTTDTFDLYIGNGTTNTRFQKYIASGTTSQLLRGDGSLLTMPIVLTSPSSGQVLKFNGTNWVNDSDSGITGSGTTNYLPKFASSTTLNNSSAYDSGAGITVERAGDVILGVTATAPGSTSIYLTPNGGGFGQLSTLGSTHLRLGTNGTERARFTAGGNFLVGGISDNGLRFQVTGDGFFSGSVGIGASSLTAANLTVAKTIASDGSYGIYQLGQIQTAVTGNGGGYINALVTIASTNLTNYYHYRALEGTIGATTSITNNYGYHIADMATGTNRYGYFGNVSSGTGKWNLYMNGTAANYLNGTLSIGTTANDTGYLRNYATIPVLALQNPTTGTAVSDGFQLSVSGSLAYIWQYENSAMLFGTNATERMRLDASGNLGLGVQPSAWGSLYKAIQIGSQSAFFGYAGNLTWVGTNVYVDSSDVARYITTASATLYRQNLGSHSWFNAISGSANASVTFSQLMTLDASGNLGLGVVPSAWSTGTFFLAQQIGGGGSFIAAPRDTSSQIIVGTNAHFNGTNWIRTTANASAFYQQSAGQHAWFNAPSGTAGTATTLTQAMTLFATGNLAIGTGAGADAGFRLDVNGTMRVSGASTFGTSVNVTSGVLNQGYLLNAAGTTALTRLQMGTAVTLFSNNYNAFSPASQDNNTIPSWQIRFGGGAGADFYRIERSPAGSTTMSQFFNLDGTGAATFSSSVTGASFIPTSSTIPTNGMYLSTTNTLAFATASGNRLTIASTGVATFSSTINVGGTATFTNSSSVNIVGTSTLVGATARNTSTASGDTQAGFFVENGTSNGQLYKAGTNYTTRKTIAANDLGFYNAAAGNISILNDFASGSIILTAGGSSTAQWTIGANGDLTAADGENIIVGTTNGTKIGTSGSQKLGFWNATPIVQPNNSVAAANFVAGIGTSVTTLDAFDGYTIGQVVRALRNAGILS